NQLLFRGGLLPAFSTMSDTPERVLELAEAIRAAGGRALLVGGCVRDELMGRQPKDWDVEVYGVDPSRVREILDRFGEVNVVGEFAARFEFDIDEQTADLCRSIDLSDLPAERIWGEMAKLLLRARRPAIGVDWLRKLGAIDQLFPELKALIEVPQDPEWHPEGDVFVHTC